MRAEVLRGQLTYIDTNDGQIQILDRADNQTITLDFDAATKISPSKDWESLIGDAVEAVVIDGKTRSIYSSPIEG